MKLERLNFLCMAQDTMGGKVHLAMDRCEGLAPCGLYLVTLTRQRGKELSTSRHYVLAPNEAEGIAQVEILAFPEADTMLDVTQQSELTATATRIPLHVRGWGVQAF